MNCKKLLKTGSRNLEVYLRGASMTKLKREKKSGSFMRGRHHVRCSNYKFARGTLDYRITNYKKKKLAF